MKAHPDDVSDERIESALREWGQRPPSTQPQTAARQVVAHIQAEHGPTVWRQPLLAAAGVALVVTTAWLGVRLMEPPPHSDRRVVDEAPPPLPENVVQWWLDSETPVYFVTGPLESRRGD
jgi:hypothetical protein